MRFRSRQQPDAEVSMGPLIDCVFLLLIFFLVATMYKKKDRDIDIIPPESSSAIKIPPDDDQLVIGINDIGEVFLQGDPISKTSLHAELRDLSQSDPDRQIRLDAHFSAPFENVVEVLDICKFRGLANVGIRTYDERYNTR
jgi:biopolymer transport protein ExbD